MRIDTNRILWAVVLAGLAACSEDDTDRLGEATADAGAPTGSGGTCQSDADCPAEEVCDFFDASCGDLGVCRTRAECAPVAGPDVYCDCRGNRFTAEDGCLDRPYRFSGTDRSCTNQPPGGVDSGPSGVACGDVRCAPSSEICVEVQRFGPSEYRCVAVPSECGGDPTCACLEAVACTDFEGQICGDDEAPERIVCACPAC